MECSAVNLAAPGLIHSGTGFLLKHIADHRCPFYLQMPFVYIFLTSMCCASSVMYVHVTSLGNCIPISLGGVVCWVSAPGEVRVASISN